MAVWIALAAVFIALIPALLIARAKANSRTSRSDGGGFVASDAGGHGKSKNDSDGDGSSDGGGGDGGGGGD